MAPTAASATLSYATVLRGRASWYGRWHQGRRTSNGERFNRFKYTCAHKSLPFGTRLRVTNIKTGKSVVVRVSDRGPFRHQRILDLSEVAARPLGLVEQGAANVIAQVVPATTPLGPSHAPRNLLALQAADPNPAAAFTSYEVAGRVSEAPVVAANPTPPTSLSQAAAPAAPATTRAASYLVQAGTYATLVQAQAMRARLLALDPALTIEVKEALTDGQPFNQVLVSQLDTWLAAETVRRRLQWWGITSVVRQSSEAAQTVAVATATP